MLKILIAGKVFHNSWLFEILSTTCLIRFVFEKQAQGFSNPFYLQCTTNETNVSVSHCHRIISEENN